MKKYYHKSAIDIISKCIQMFRERNNRLKDPKAYSPTHRPPPFIGLAIRGSSEWISYKDSGFGT